MPQKLPQTVRERIRSAQRKLAVREGVSAADSKRSRVLAKSMPRGLTIGQFDDGRAKPFFVRCRGSVGRLLESFASEFERNERAIVLRREVEEAIGAYLEVRAYEDLSADSISHMRVSLERFAGRFGALGLSEVGSEDVVLWLSKLREEWGGAAVTVAHHRKALSAFYNYAVRVRWAAENPCAAVPSPRIARREDVGGVSLRDAFEFFRANRNARAVGRLATEAFGGLRYSSAARLAFADLDFENAAITLPAAKHKTGRRKRPCRHAVPSLRFPPRRLWLRLSAPLCSDQLKEPV